MTNQIPTLQAELRAMVDRHETARLTADERFELGIQIRDLAFHLKHVRKNG